MAFDPRELDEEELLGAEACWARQVAHWSDALYAGRRQLSATEWLWCRELLSHARARLQAIEERIAEEVEVIER